MVRPVSTSNTFSVDHLTAMSRINGYDLDDGFKRGYSNSCVGLDLLLHKWFSQSTSAEQSDWTTKLLISTRPSNLAVLVYCRMAASQ